MKAVGTTWGKKMAYTLRMDPPRTVQRPGFKSQLCWLCGFEGKTFYCWVSVLSPGLAPALAVARKIKSAAQSSRQDS